MKLLLPCMLCSEWQQLRIPQGPSPASFCVILKVVAAVLPAAGTAMGLLALEVCLRNQK